MDQLVTHEPLTMQASVQSQATSCIICHEQKSIGIGLFP